MLAEKHGTSVLCVVSPIACHTMANENQGTDRESDVFDVLKRYDIVFVDHVKCLLKNLGYKCLRSTVSVRLLIFLPYKVLSELLYIRKIALQK